MLLAHAALTLAGSHEPSASRLIRPALECKDLLKERGYRWNSGSDGRPRAWYRDLDRELLVEEELFLAEKIYAGGPCRHQLIRIDYSNRFSDRV